jgi:hypothetical protein
MQGAVLVAKMNCHYVSKDEYAEGLTLYPVYAEEGINKRWSEATPAGSLNLTISNPAARGKVEQGKDYLIYIVPCGEDE